MKIPLWSKWKECSAKLGFLQTILFLNLIYFTLIPLLYLVVRFKRFENKASSNPGSQ